MYALHYLCISASFHKGIEGVDFSGSLILSGLGLPEALHPSVFLLASGSVYLSLSALVAVGG